MTEACWPVATLLTTDRLRLEPLRAEHAAEAFPVFDDRRLHIWTGGAPAGWPEFQEQYRRRATGRSPDGRRGWLNWLLRRVADGQLVGVVQATLYRRSPAVLAAELAWIVGADYQGSSYASEASAATIDWLIEQGVSELTAAIHPGNAASITVARRLGMYPTEVQRDGEVLWIAHPRQASIGAEPG
jgi:RimJ/RimL family protein N-acetyltransferase